MNPKQTGSIIAQKRKELGLKQTQLAEILNVSNRTVSKWENGDGFPDITLLPEISNTLGISIDFLLTGEDRRTKETEENEKPKSVYTSKNIFKFLYVIALFLAAFSALLGGITELYCIWAFPVLFYTHWEIMFAAVSLVTTVLGLLAFILGAVRLNMEYSKKEIIIYLRKKAAVLLSLFAVFPLTFLARIIDHSRWGYFTPYIMAVIIIVLILLGSRIYKKTGEKK